MRARNRKRFGKIACGFALLLPWSRIFPNLTGNPRLRSYTKTFPAAPAGAVSRFSCETAKEVGNQCLFPRKGVVHARHTSAGQHWNLRLRGDSCGIKPRLRALGGRNAPPGDVSRC